MQAEQSHFSQPVLIVEVLYPSDDLPGPPLGAFRLGSIVSINRYHRYLSRYHRYEILTLSNLITA